MAKNTSTYKPHKTKEAKTTNQRDRPRTEEGGVKEAQAVAVFIAGII